MGLDRLPEPSPDFYREQQRAAEELGNTLHYRQIDVRDVPQLNEIIRSISETHGHLDGLVAAAGIQQETSALDYSAQDANTMFEVNVTGVFMSAQAVAREMIRWGNGGSIAMITSMSGTIANRGLICPAYNASKAARLHRHGHGRGPLRPVPRTSPRLADAEYARPAEQAGRVPRCGCVPHLQRQQFYDRVGSEDGWWTCCVVENDGRPVDQSGGFGVVILVCWSLSYDGRNTL